MDKMGDQDYCSGELKQTSTKNLIAMTFKNIFNVKDID